MNHIQFIGLRFCTEDLRNIAAAQGAIPSNTKFVRTIYDQESESVMLVYEQVGNDKTEILNGTRSLN